MVSVIIPNYNHAPYLKKRIDSVLNQTFEDFELIILDDCSTDNSRDIIEVYRTHPKVSHIIYNEKNSGSTFKQWEKGLDLAKGEFVWIAESDDWAELFMLETLVSAFDKDTVISFCHSSRVWSEDTLPPENVYNFLYVRYEGKDFIKKNMLAFNSIDNASMAVFRKSKIQQSWFKEISNMRYCGDWLFWIKLLQNGKIVEFPERYNYFRQHSHKVTSRAQQLGLDFIEGISILRYIESEVKIKIPYRVLEYWAQVWCTLRWQFSKGIARKTCFKLISYKFAFIYLIPIYLYKKRFKKKKV